MSKESLDEVERMESSKDFMLEQEARELVATIRKKHTSVGYEELAVILCDLLDLTSSDLYDTKTHFLLELLQNADDNRYPTHSVPTLTFTCDERTGSLRVDCNETGFEAKHVQAISTVRRSTKSGKNHSGGFTGEKGIGFKSVYRVAEKVWIASRQYRFMFDNTERFGIIAPKWANFPGPTIEDQTSFYLQLADPIVSVDLTKELHSFGPNLLVFLRRLRRLELSVYDRDNKIWNRTFRKQVLHEEGDQIIAIHMDESQIRYRTSTYQAQNLPVEKKRTSSHLWELVLAFPVTDLPAQPSQCSQYVHALLPISDYGLKFLLNGDFLLTADRSHIDVSNLWNQSLRDNLTDAFILAVHNLSRNSMKYFWPFFVPDSEVSEFFQPFREAVLRKLGESKALEAWNGEMCRPSDLVYVCPGRFSDRNSRPFTLYDDTASHYLSAKYPEWLIGSLLDLGVSEMSESTFLTDLESMVSKRSIELRLKPPDWHSHLAKVLLPLAQTAAHKAILEKLPIIPLSNGQWTSADKNPVFFNRDLNPKSFVLADDMRIIEPLAAAEEHRRSLYQKLGILEVERPEVCSHIAKLHGSVSFDPHRIPRKDLVSHAVFLFESSWRPTHDIDLWFATSDGGVCKGSQLYLKVGFEPGSIAGKIFDKLEKEFSTPHREYTSYVKKSPRQDMEIQENARLISDVLDLVSDGPSNELHFSDITHDADQSAVSVTIFDTSTWDRFSFGTVYETDSVDAPARTIPATLLHSDPIRPFDYLSVDYFYNTLLFPGPSPETDVDSFKSYLTKTLRLSSIPRLVTHLENKRFALSEEFKFLFRECPVSDVLRLLVEHWEEYSEWIEMDSHKRQNPVLVESHENLLKDIRNSLVRTQHGLKLLCQTILSCLDPHIKRLEIPVTTIDIEGSEDRALRRKLGLLGIKVEADLDYYLSCLFSLADQGGSPEQNAVLHVYEHIQSRYEDDEVTVLAAFEFIPALYIGPRGGKTGRWLTITQCRKERVDPCAIYPTCHNLFSELFHYRGTEIDAVVDKAASIDRYWTLTRILDVLADLSAILAPMTPAKARHSVQPLMKKMIFPVRKKEGYETAWELCRPCDNSWFIADRPHLAKSFAGRVPLLALSPGDLNTVGPLFQAMGLQPRYLTKLVETTVYPSRTSVFSHSDTRFFHARLKYVQRLIPKAEKGMATICLQLELAEISIVEHIYQVYSFTFDGSQKHASHKTECDATVLTNRSGNLSIYIARRSHVRKQLPFELIDMIAEHCRITDSRDLSLLYTALSEPDTRRVQTAFAVNGHYFDRSDNDDDNEDNDGDDDDDDDSDSDEDSRTRKGRRARRPRSGDIFKLSDFFSDMESSDDEDSQLRKRLSYSKPKRFARRRRWRGRYENADRRIPLVSFTKLGAITNEDPVHAQGLFWQSHKLDPSDHLQYLGQTLVSGFLQKYLGPSYDPIQHWTSPLRSRAGLPAFEVDDGPAPFTLGDPHSSARLTELLAKLDKFPKGMGDGTAWRSISPRYHFEVVVLEGDATSSFVWNLEQLRRIRRYRLERSLYVGMDVMLLVRVSDVYNNPQFEILFDPWQLVLSDSLRLEGKNKCLATINNGCSSTRSASVRKPWAAPLLSSIHYQDTISLPYHQAPWTIRQATGERTRNHLYLEEVEGGCEKSIPLTVSRKVRVDFSYKALGAKQTRMFMLFPGKNEAPLTGMIFACSSIKNSGPYRTLSYEWGLTTTTPLHKLWTPDGFLTIRDSLNTCLRRLRDEKSPIVLWVDAICINQNDKIEKARQIRLLPEIFQNATRTMAFLSAQTQYDKAMETLLQVAAKDTYGRAAGRNWPDGLDPVDPSWEERSSPQPSDPIWPSISKLFESNWFRRVWIVQEAVIAPTVTIVCGSWTADWNDIQTAIRAIEREHGGRLGAFSSSWGPFMRLSHLRDHEAHRRRWNLLSLLETFRHVKSTLRRDRFFALLGLASDGNEKDFEPDYRENTSFSSIASRFGRVFVSQGHGMHLLYRAGLNPTSNGFPSWLPDLTCPFLNHLHDKQADFNASGTRDEEIRWLNGNLLRATGGYVDEIMHISNHSNSNEARECSEYFKELDSMVDSLRKFYPQDRLEEMKWRVPVAGTTEFPINDTDLQDSYKAFREVLKKAAFRRGRTRVYDRKPEADFDAISGVLSAGTRREKSAAYSSLLSDNIRGWKFVTTKRNLCGIVPGAARVGDRVCVLFGGNIPFVMRRSTTRSYCHELIGGCYVDGIMQGEALGFDGFETKYFDIC